MKIKIWMLTAFTSSFLLTNTLIAEDNHTGNFIQSQEIQTTVTNAQEIKPSLPIAASTDLKDHVFPASIRIHTTSPIINIIKKKYAVDDINENYIDIYIDSKNEYNHFKNAFIDLINEKDLSITVLQSNEDAQRNFTDTSLKGVAYHTYDSALAEIRDLQSRFPDIVKVISLGKSASGTTDVWAIKVSDNVDNEEDEPSTFIAAGIHGNERPGPEVALYILEHIATNYSKDQFITQLVNTTQMWFIPITNPDGHKRNRRRNANGVDLNRDFPASWNYFQKTMAQQPETRAIVNNLNNHHFVAGIDLHTYGELVMYPWAHTSSSAQDLDVFKELGNMIGNAMGRYRVNSLNNFFGIIYGGTIDYEYGALGIIALGEELGNSHSPSVRTMDLLRKSNLDPALKLLNRINHSTITGIVSDSQTKQPLEATIKVLEVDIGGARNNFTSRPEFGRYYRMLPVGSYTIEVSAPGYETRTYYNMNINNSAQTALNVNLTQH